MPKSGEITYMEKISEGERKFAIGKPFTSNDCGILMAEVGQMMQFLSPPPGKVLDLGCGTGWTSILLAKRGYDVVGQDIAPEMTEAAEGNRQQERLENCRFITSDFESLEFNEEFDGAFFYEALHHAENEKQALRSVFRALRGGGICVLSEPGVGHSRTTKSREAMKKYNVTERDMPASKIIRTAREVGFRSGRAYPHVAHINTFVYGNEIHNPVVGKFAPVLRFFPIRLLAIWLIMVACRFTGGITVLMK
jgi:ubiquinone/menaquinone biosynthesis C-methylase UbiE